MKTVLTFSNTNELTLPAEFQSADVRFSDDMVAYFIEQFSIKGDVVFDPFAGFGTTLHVAERLGRRGYGVEYLPERVGYIQSVIRNKANIICGSALEMDGMSLPPIDFSITSPPYMTRNNHDEYPFAGYQVTGAGYSQYLADIQSVYRQLRSRLKPGARAVIEVSNIISEDVLTTLAWDVARSVAEVLTLEREIIINWERQCFGFSHSYCLVFRNA